MKEITNGGGCDGCVYGGRCVRGYGPSDARFVVVGEAPGAVELGTGRPFVGSSGELLWSTLRRIGLPDGTPVFRTNALSCQPTSSSGPTREAIDACRSRVNAEISALNAPRIIVALGNAALRSLTGNHSLHITTARGTAIKTDLGLVVPTLHPAAVLRIPAEHRKFKDDLAYAVRLWKGEAVNDPGETRFEVVESSGALQWALIEMHKAGVVAADIETTGLDATRDTVLCMGVAVGNNQVFVFPDWMLNELHDALADPNIRWVWHNGKFDTQFLQRRGLPARVDEDTMLMHYALDEYRGHGLKELSTQLLGASEYEDVLKPYLKKSVANPHPSFAGIPVEVLYPYLARDCDYTLQLYDHFKPKLTAQRGLGDLYTNILIPGSNFLRDVEMHGLWLDIEAVEKLAEELNSQLDAALLRVGEYSKGVWDADAYMRASGAKKKPAHFNPRSPMQLSFILYDVLRIGPTNPALPFNTSKATLLDMSDKHPLIGAILDMRRADKMLSTYVTKMLRVLGPDGRVHTTYLQHGTETGRLSSADPNLQNVPRRKDVRSIFAAPPGHVLIEVDFSAHELRCLAHMSGDPALIAAISGGDMHSEVAAAIFGARFTEADPNGEEYKEMRTIAKTVSFGIMYGRTGHGLAKGIGCTVEEGQQMVVDWAKRFPDAWRFLQFCRDAPLRGKTLQTPFGRQRRFPLINFQNKNSVQNEASNFPIQSLSADLTLLSAIKMAPRLKSLGCHIVNTVHDSILVECPNEPALIELAVRVATEVMVQVPDEALGGTKIPFAAEAKVGRSWGHMVVQDEPFEKGEEDEAGRSDETDEG